MKLTEIDPCAGLDQILHWSDKEVYLLKVRNTDEYFVSLTNTVNFGDLTEAKIFEDRLELELQFRKLPIKFSRGNVWEVLKITLENI